MMITTVSQKQLNTVLLTVCVSNKCTLHVFVKSFSAAFLIPAKMCCKMLIIRVQTMMMTKWIYAAHHRRIFSALRSYTNCNVAHFCYLWDFHIFAETSELYVFWSTIGLLLIPLLMEHPNFWPTIILADIPGVMLSQFKCIVKLPTQDWDICHIKLHQDICRQKLNKTSREEVPSHSPNLCPHLTSLAPSVLPRVGPGHPSFPLSIYFLIFSPFYFSLSFIGFTCFLLLSIPFLSTRIVPLRFKARGRRRRPNLGLVCVLLCGLCYLYSLVKMDCGVLFYLV